MFGQKNVVFFSNKTTSHPRPALFQHVKPSHLKTSTLNPQPSTVYTKSHRDLGALQLEVLERIKSTKSQGYTKSHLNLVALEVKELKRVESDEMFGDTVDLVAAKGQPHQPCIRVVCEVSKVVKKQPRLVFDHFSKGCGGLARSFLGDRSNRSGTSESSAMRCSGTLSIWFSRSDGRISPVFARCMCYEYGTSKTVKASFWLWLSGKSSSSLSLCSLVSRKRGALGTVSIWFPRSDSRTSPVFARCMCYEYGTHKTVKAIFRPGLAGKVRKTL